MKTMKKNFYTLMFALVLISSSLFAQKKEVIFVTSPVTGGKPYLDSAIINAIKEYGGGMVYNVTAEYTPTNNGLITSAMKAQLSAADVVIMGRAIASGNLTPAKTVWDSITKPVISFQHFAFRSDRLDWYSSTTGGGNNTTKPDTILKAVVLQKNDPVFAGITLIGDSMFDWWTSHFSFMPNNVLANTNGTVMAKTLDNKPLFIRWPANTPYYTSATHRPLAERVYITNGQDNTVPYSYWNFTTAAKTVFFNELARLTGIPTGVELSKNKASQLSVYAYAGNIAVSSTDLMSRVDVFSISGKLIVSKEVKSSYVKLNTSLNDGIYIVKAYNSKGVATTKKLLVKR